MNPAVKLLDVSRVPTLGATLQVTFPDGETVVVRWGLDEETFGPLKRAFETRFFDSLAEHETFLRLTYTASGPNGSPERQVYAHIEKVSGRNRKQITITCSEQFAGNLKWFQESVHDSGDLRHLVVEPLVQSDENAD